jgi:hypothetical protein
MLRYLALDLQSWPNLLADATLDTARRILDIEVFVNVWKWYLCDLSAGAISSSVSTAMWSEGKLWRLLLRIWKRSSAVQGGMVLGSLKGVEREIILVQ